MELTLKLTKKIDGADKELLTRTLAPSDFPPDTRYREDFDYELQGSIIAGLLMGQPDVLVIRLFDGATELCSSISDCNHPDRGERSMLRLTHIVRERLGFSHLPSLPA
jgi:hypothetical protein